MYRGLATRHHQAADWLGLGRGGFGPASATSNAEYGGWFGQDATFTRPALPRTRSEATSWRNAGVGVDLSPNVEVAGLVQLLRETESNASVRSNSLNPLNNTKAGPYSGSVGPAGLAYNFPSNKSSSYIQGDGKIVEIYDGKSSSLDASRRPNLNPPSVSFGGRSSFADQFSGSEATRDGAQHSYALQTQLLRGQLESDLLQLRKSSTALDLLSDRTDKTGKPTLPYAKHEDMSRSILGAVPLWRNRLSQNRLISTDSYNRQEPPYASEGPCLLSSVSCSSDPATNRWERVTYGETTSSKTPNKDDVLANCAMLDRFRDDRLSNCERTGPKLEPMMQADAQPGLSRQKQNLCPILGDDGTQKLGRYDGSPVLEPNSVHCWPSAARQPRFAQEADNFSYNGPRTAQSVISGPSQLESQHKINVYSDLPAATAVLNDAKYSKVPDFTAVPKKSILKKPGVYSKNERENGAYGGRMDNSSATRHSSGPASCFNQFDNQSSSLGEKLQEHHQKRVTFRLDQ